MVRPRTFEEDQVLDRVMEVFWRQGFESTSIDDLEAATGLGRQSLYNAFGDKHALYLRVLVRYGEQERANLGENLAAAPQVLGALRGILLTPIASIGCDKKGCLMINATMEARGDQPVVCQTVDHHTERFVGLVEALLTRGQAQGEVKAELCASATARRLIATLFGLQVLARAGSSAERLQQVVDDTIRSLTA